MRLWHKSLIRFLPDMQLKGQWRECALIARGLKENGTPNHLLVNKLTEYGIEHFYSYCVYVLEEMSERGFYVTDKSVERIQEFRCKIIGIDELFNGWHEEEYLRVCMANLYEKHVFGVGKSRITDSEWNRLLIGYRIATKKYYEI